MNNLRTYILSTALVCAMITAASAAGNAAKGKVLFNDPAFAHGVKACVSCHPDGKGLEHAADEKEFHIAGAIQNSLEDAVNACIVYAAKGTAIDPKSAEMADIVAYIRSLKTRKSTPY